MTAGRPGPPTASAVLGPFPNFVISTNFHAYICIIIPIFDNKTTIDVTTLSDRYCSPHLIGEGPKLEVAELGLNPGWPPRLRALKGTVTVLSQTDWTGNQPLVSHRKLCVHNAVRRP